MYFKRLHSRLFLSLGWGLHVVSAFPENPQSALLGLCRGPAEPTPLNQSGFAETPSTGRSPTCLLRGGDRLAVGASGSRQQELTGGSEDERRTGLPIPETWRSWEEEGSPRKAATGNVKEKVESD